MSIGRTRRTSIAIVETLRPLTGDPATGSVTITALGADVTIPAGCVLAPLARSDATANEQIDINNLFRTQRNPGPQVVNSDGVSVSLISVQGGARQNLEAGQRLRFYPEVLGVNPFVTVDADFVGGADASGPGSVRAIHRSETLSGTTAAADMFKARQYAGAPTILVAWESSGVAEAIGRDRSQRSDRWTIYCIAARGSNERDRAETLLDIKDGVEALLVDRSSVGGYAFSAPPARILGTSRLIATKSSYIYTVAVETVGQVKRTDTRGPNSVDGELTFADWLRTCLDSETQDAPPFPIVRDYCWNMLLGPFDTGFDEGFEI